MNANKSKDATKLVAVAAVLAVVLCGCVVVASDDSDAADSYDYTVDGTTYTSLKSLFSSVNTFSSGTTIAVSIEDSLDASMVSSLSGAESNVKIYVVDGGNLTVTLGDSLAITEYHVMSIGSGSGLTLKDDSGMLLSVDGACTDHSDDDLAVFVSGTSVMSIGGAGDNTSFHGDVAISTSLQICDLDMSGCDKCGLTIAAGMLVDVYDPFVFTTSSSTEKNINAGTISIGTGGSVVVSEGGTFENTGTISLAGGDTIASFRGNGTLVNSGTVSIAAGNPDGSTLSVATIVNSGEITLSTSDEGYGSIGGNSKLYMSGSGKVVYSNGSDYTGDICVQAGDTWTITDAIYSDGVISNNITVEEGGTLVVDGEEFSIGDGKTVTVSSGGTLVLTEDTTLYVNSLTDGNGDGLDPDGLSLADGAAIIVDSSKSQGSLVLTDGQGNIGDGSGSSGDGSGDGGSGSGGEGGDGGDGGSDGGSGKGTDGTGGGAGSSEPVHSFTVYYDANGGSDAPATQRFTTTATSATLTLSSAVPTRSGYTFLGWSTDSGATSAEYLAGGSITITGDGSFSTSVTLYAVWAYGSVSGSGGGSSGSGTGSGSGSGTSDGGSSDGSGSDWWFWLLIILIIIILVAISAWRGYEDRKKD